MNKVLAFILFIVSVSPSHAVDFDRRLKIFEQLNDTANSCEVGMEDQEGEWCRDLQGWACKNPPGIDGTETKITPLSEKMDLAHKEVDAPFTKDILELMKKDKSVEEAVKKLAAETDLTCTDCPDEMAANYVRTFWSDSAFVPSPEFGQSREAVKRKFPKILEDKNEQYMKLISNRLRDKALEEKLDKEIFPDIKKLLAEEIMKSIPDKEAAKKMVQKMEKVRFAGTQCQSNAVNSAGFKGAYIVNDEKDPHFFYCAGFLQDTTSIFRIAYIMAHELSHSIDPCHMPDEAKTFEGREKMDEKFPGSEILSCLRSPDSIGAKWSEDIFNGKEEGFPKHALYCFGDQTSESYSDWMAAQILPKYLSKSQPHLTTEQTKNGYANIAHSLECTQPKSEINFGGPVSISAHPDSKGRMNNILMANPELRKQVGCYAKPEKPVYCHTGMDKTSYRKAVKPVAPSGNPFGIGGPSMLPSSGIHRDPAGKGCFH